MFGWIKDKLLVIMGIAIGVLFAWVKVKGYQNDRLKEELEEAEINAQVTEHDAVVKEFQAINKERANNVEDSDSDIKPDTTYKL